MRTAEESKFPRDKDRYRTTGEGVGEHTDITPHWRPIRSIPAPYNGVYEVGETSKCRPDQVQASPRILSLQMPGQRNERNDEPYSGEYCERGVGDGHIGPPRLLKPPGRKVRSLQTALMHTSKTCLGDRARDVCHGLKVGKKKERADNSRREETKGRQCILTDMFGHYFVRRYGIRKTSDRLWVLGADGHQYVRCHMLHVTGLRAFGENRPLSLNSINQTTLLFSTGDSSATLSPRLSGKEAIDPVSKRISS